MSITHQNVNVRGLESKTSMLSVPSFYLHIFSDRRKMLCKYWFKHIQNCYSWWHNLLRLILTFNKKKYFFVIEFILPQTNPLGCLKFYDSILLQKYPFEQVYIYVSVPYIISLSSNTNNAFLTSEEQVTKFLLGGHCWPKESTFFVLDYLFKRLLGR